MADSLRQENILYRDARIILIPFHDKILNETLWDAVIEIYGRPIRFHAYPSCAELEDKCKRRVDALMQSMQFPKNKFPNPPKNGLVEWLTV